MAELFGHRSEEEHLLFHRRLRQELETWREEGLISPEQKAEILARYKALKDADEKAGPGKLITAVTILGSILVGLGILLFVAANWSEIPKWGKLALIFVSMIAAYGGGFYVRYDRKTYPKVGAALILLGSLIFGAGIFLIAQIYHITVHYPNGPLLWGLGVIPIAYLLGLRTILYLAVVDILVWLGMEASFHVTAGGFLYGGPFRYVTLFLMAGLSLWITGLMHRGRDSLKALSSPYIVIGAMVTFLAGYVLTFDVFRAVLGSRELMAFYLGIIALFAASGALYAISDNKEEGWLPEAGMLFFVMILSFILSLFHHGASTSPRIGRHADALSVMTLVSNLVFVLAIMGVIVLGYRRRYKPYINIGLLFFVLDIIARYFDFFWRLLPRSIFFIVGGLILISGGVFLEKKRRRVFASFNIGEAVR